MTMRSRTNARWLAPLALLAAAAAVWFTVNGTVGINSDGDESASTTTTAERTERDRGERTTTSETTTTAAKPRRRTYRVKPGDTFGAIAEQTGLTVEELQELNPSLDPNSLTVGQTVKLR